jgi:hypothetical protein
MYNDVLYIQNADMSVLDACELPVPNALFCRLLTLIECLKLPCLVIGSSRHGLWQTLNRPEISPLRLITRRSAAPCSPIEHVFCLEVRLTVLIQIRVREWRSGPARVCFSHIGIHDIQILYVCIYIYAVQKPRQ